jgi:hypothetical protein
LPHQQELDDLVAALMLVMLVVRKHFVLDLEMLQQGAEVRVSSASIRSASFKIRMALKVISSRLPMGVGTKYSLPVGVGFMDDDSSLAW